jgi:hypothetical protein
VAGGNQRRLLGDLRPNKVSVHVGAEIPNIAKLQRDVQPGPFQAALFRLSRLLLAAVVEAAAAYAVLSRSRHDGTGARACSRAADPRSAAAMTLHGTIRQPSSAIAMSAASARKTSDSLSVTCMNKMRTEKRRLSLRGPQQAIATSRGVKQRQISPVSNLSL